MSPVAVRTASAFVLLPALACVSHPGDADTTTPALDPDECPAMEDPATSVEATDIPTVLRVRWSTPAASTSWVEFTDADGVVRTSPPVAGDAGAHDALLLGLPANTDVTYRVVDEGPDETRCSTSAEARTAGLDAALPEFSVAEPLPDEVEPGYLVAPFLGEDASSLNVIDTAGRYVWSMPVGDRTLRVRKSIDGQALLYNEVVAGSGMLVRVGFDGIEQARTAVPNGHTDFVEVAPRHYVVLGFDVRPFGDSGRRFVGDELLDVDEAGESRVLWSTFDSFSPDLDRTYPTDWLPEDPDAEDWTHANGLSYDAGTDSLMVVLGGLNTVVRLDRSTGAVIDVIGGSTSNFATADGLLSNPHSAELLPGGNLLVFNRNQFGVECSEAVEIALDRGAATATEVWRYASDTCLGVYYLGEAKRLPGGNTLTVFATSGEIDQATPAGETAWRLSLDLGAGVGFSDHVASLY
jgi:hypothetical protein